MEIIDTLIENTDNKLILIENMKNRVKELTEKVITAEKGTALYLSGLEITDVNHLSDVEIEDLIAASEIVEFHHSPTKQEIEEALANLLFNDNLEKYCERAYNSAKTSIDKAHLLEEGPLSECITIAIHQTENHHLLLVEKD